MSIKESTGADDVQAKIATYESDFRPVAERLHETIMNAGVKLYPRLWYGMPGYAASEKSAVLVYFRKDKYITFGQTESSHVEFNNKTNSAAVSWYFTELNDAAIAKIVSTVKSAVR